MDQIGAFLLVSGGDFLVGILCAQGPHHTGFLASVGAVDGPMKCFYIYEFENTWDALLEPGILEFWSAYIRGLL